MSSMSKLFSCRRVFNCYTKRWGGDEGACSKQMPMTSICRQNDSRSMKRENFLSTFIFLYFIFCYSAAFAMLPRRKSFRFALMQSSLPSMQKLYRNTRRPKLFQLYFLSIVVFTSTHWIFFLCLHKYSCGLRNKKRKMIKNDKICAHEKPTYWVNGSGRICGWKFELCCEDTWIKLSLFSEKRVKNIYRENRNTRIFYKNSLSTEHSCHRGLEQKFLWGKISLSSWA